MFCANRADGLQQVDEALAKVQTSHETDSERSVGQRTPRSRAKAVEIHRLPQDMNLLRRDTELHHGALAPVGVHADAIDKLILFLNAVHHRGCRVTAEFLPEPTLRIPFADFMDIAALTIFAILYLL